MYVSVYLLCIVYGHTLSEADTAVGRMPHQHLLDFFEHYLVLNDGWGVASPRDSVKVGLYRSYAIMVHVHVSVYAT